MNVLDYPFDASYILKKRKSIKRKLLAENDLFTEKKIAVLGGSTTSDIRQILELFLLNYKIKAEFYESEYNQYYQDAMFDPQRLTDFAPDIIFIHTSNRNIYSYPSIEDSKGDVEDKLLSVVRKYTNMWDHLYDRYHCVIIQNNMELPFYRLFGNSAASDYRGIVHFINCINMKFAEYAQVHENFFINDIHYQSSYYGLEKWADPFYWYMYKYALCIDAIPLLAFNVANIIKSLYGRNQKAIAVDLDHTLWGGTIGDDGIENLEIGQETSTGQAYIEFQKYLKELKDQGVLLNIISKNEYENVKKGLEHPQMFLKEGDFISIKANWEPKSQNLFQIAKELELLPESFLFVDDNPAEREIIRQQAAGTAIAELTEAEHYIEAIDHAGYFEMTMLSEDDLKRNAMYKDNISRIRLQETFTDYKEYLQSLKMEAVIRPFEEIYIPRIAQLTNKSNQFNLTTRRYTKEEIRQAAEDPAMITLYGKLIDRFGDNGIVSVIIGKIHGENLDILLWLMSCRVLKRDMEYAMMDALVWECQKHSIKILNGYYYPTAKNGMVQNFYKEQGFEFVSQDSKQNSVWRLDISEGYHLKNCVIQIKDDLS